MDRVKRIKKIFNEKEKKIFQPLQKPS